MGSSTWIFGVSYTIIHASPIMKGGIRLLVMEVTCKELLMTTLQVIMMWGQSYHNVASNIGILFVLYSGKKALNSAKVPESDIM